MNFWIRQGLQSEKNEVEVSYPTCKVVIECYIPGYAAQALANLRSTALALLSSHPRIRAIVRMNLWLIIFVSLNLALRPRFTVLFAISSTPSVRQEASAMNPETDEGGPIPLAKDPKRKRVFLRRLQNQLSESRMLEVLDRTLQISAENGRHSTLVSNQEQDEQDGDEQKKEEKEEELVCVSKMVKMADTEPKSSEFQVGGVLKTVRNIHRQRAIQSEQHENQTEH